MNNLQFFAISDQVKQATSVTNSTSTNKASKLIPFISIAYTRMCMCCCC